MRLLILGDLHGQKPRFRFKDFDAVITPGDFCYPNDLRKYQFRFIREKLKNPEIKYKWYDIVGKKKTRALIKKSLFKGRMVLESLDSVGVPVFIVPGNWDFTQERDSKWNFLKKGHFKNLISGLKNVKNTHMKISNFKDYAIVGYGISSGPEVPQHKEDMKNVEKKVLEKKLKKSKKEYEQKYQRVSKLFGKAKKPIIFLSHNVPFNTKLDKITTKSSPRYGYHYGSLITRDIIEKYQPLISIAGHMHENLGKTKIGKTVCINSGFGSKVNVLLELEGKTIKKIKFHNGK
ncbi:MAG: metallophosphoesterase [Candidatus Aenigmarchaeota archaeon]|nr:metallophosphoesterase [Candidatus Aenigmarchaeota archaeon]